MNIDELIYIEASSLGYDGPAIGRIDGLVVFINGAVPGDKLLARITRLSKNYGVADTVEVISPSSFRRDPLCIHFTEGCGGCQWQHIAYECQIYWKRKAVEEALKRIGKQGNLPEANMYTKLDVQKDPSDPDPGFGYRNRLRLFPSENPNILGLRKNKSHEVVPIKKCLISRPEINALSPVFTGEVFSINSDLSEVDIRVSEEYNQVMVACTYRHNNASIRKDMDNLWKLPNITSVFYRTMDKARNFKLAYGEQIIKKKIGEIEYRISHDCFFQVNSDLLGKLVESVKEMAGEDNGVVFDAHCGVGTFALQVAGNSEMVWGNDISFAAVDLARLNARDNNISNAQFRAGKASKTLKDDLKDIKIDLAILDPPRDGCEKLDLQALIQSKPKRIIYVSCNPTTLARDLQELSSSGYNIQKIDLFDMFPMTYHSEIVALLAI